MGEDGRPYFQGWGFRAADVAAGARELAQSGMSIHDINSGPYALPGFSMAELMQNLRPYIEPGAEQG